MPSLTLLEQRHQDAVMISHQRRADIIDALRRGTVPQYGLDALAVGLAPFDP